VTQAEPFSFSDRDAAMVERKQQKIAAILDEQKKQREFKAKPVRKTIIYLLLLKQK
jgi:hypothetical protein